MMNLNHQQLDYGKIDKHYPIFSNKKDCIDNILGTVNNQQHAAVG
jgi:hypothetical protein